ncbi:MAG: secretin N-terminal domain-containing protein [Planctomycetota bacterium]|nr:secretin N-terminal domain-containing protein [Planctomycetota bacterium]
MLLASFAIGVQFGWLATDANAQDSPAAAPASATPVAMPAGANMTPEMQKKFAEAQAAAAKNGKPGDKKPKDAKPEEAKPGDAKKPEAKPAEGITKRPDKPETPPNADELKVRPDEQGKIRFSFNGQPWPAVLEWYAKVANLSLDWQELPGDYLNLSTQQAYTIDETRDLINRHLLARGFTMLQQGETLSVVDIKKLDPSAVPRVLPQNLAQRSSSEFVKVSFELDSMIAETAAEELKPMLSPNGKLVAMKKTNRLEAIDAVRNLQEIYNLLQDEQSAAGQDRLVPEFFLKHARAEEVRTQLNALLGIEDKPSGPPSPQEMQQRMQQQQMEAQMRQNGQKPPEKPKSDVHLVVNVRNNSIVVHASPDKLAIIKQAVKVLDVPGKGGENGNSKIGDMKIYRLATIDPESLVTTLNEMRVLDPTTNLQIDKKNKSIIVTNASLSDHATIGALLAKMDGGGREFHMFQLRKLEADYVAGTIEHMMADEKEKPQQSRRFYYDFGYGNNNQSEEKGSDKFRVDSDVENNRLLLWANAVELQKVTKLLTTLGEVSERTVSDRNVRFLKLDPGQSTEEAIEQIRRRWAAVSPNQLVVPRRPVKRIEAIDPEQDPRSVPQPQRGAPVPELENRESRLKRQIPQLGTAANSDQNPAKKPKSVATAHKAIESTIVEKSVVTTLPRNVIHNAVMQATATEEETATGEGSKVQAPPTVNAESSEVDDNAGRPSPDQVERIRRILTESAAAPRQPDPITLLVSPNGEELIISSQDTAALDQFEEMLLDLKPERPEYKIFYLKVVSATMVAINLEDYFGVEPKKEKNTRRSYWDYYDDDSKKEEEPTRLSWRRPLKFISDRDTNTILVQGADPVQLRTIEELIRFYDTAEPLDSRAARMTQPVTLKYAKAKAVSDAVKDVYRDLLSATDKALQGNQQEQQNKRPENVYIYGDAGGTDDKDKTQVTFKGKLSIGVDELSNTLIVSTEGENLMQNVRQLIEALDLAAKPALTTVRVVRTTGPLDSKEVRRALARAIGEPRQPNRNQQTPQQVGPDGQPLPQNNGGQQQQSNNGQPVRNE